MKSLVLANPKRHLDPLESKEARLFPYYAGFSSVFAEQTLYSFQLGDDAVVFDPWNGSGTTTSAAAKCGMAGIGGDRNPAMVIVAKASLVSQLDAPSFIPLAHSLVERATAEGDCFLEVEPLTTWLAPQSAAAFRAIEMEINRALMSHDHYQNLNTQDALSRVTPLAAFFYIALFRAARRLLSDFIPSNPTWTKEPSHPSSRKRPTFTSISTAFLSEVQNLASRVLDSRTLFSEDGASISIQLENAESLSLSSNSVDAILTSPPYCTRIDYAVATSVELALLRFTNEQFEHLRRTLTGTSTVERETFEPEEKWGSTCIHFLRRLYNHESKASKTYYYKNHAQYFRSLYNSISEASRVLKKKSPCAIVVQDSYYKEIRNDVAQIISEMGEQVGLEFKRKADFSAKRSMVDVNTRARKYLNRRTNIESVVLFEKN